MGDRASVSFRNGDLESVTLNTHWGGLGFQREAQRFAEELKAERDPRGGMPLDRLEPDVVMVDFIRHLTKELDRVEGNLWVVATPEDSDNSDRGHVIAELS